MMDKVGFGFRVSRQVSNAGNLVESDERLCSQILVELGSIALVKGMLSTV